MTERQKAFLQATGLAGSFFFLGAIVFDQVPTFSKQQRTIAMACMDAFGPKSCSKNMELPAFKPSSLK